MNICIGSESYYYNMTFEADSTVGRDTLVTLSDSGIVTACKNGEKFCGVSTNAICGYALVQIRGYANIPYVGDISVGYQKLVAESDTKVRVSDNGREYLVVEVGPSYIGVIL